VNVSVETTKFGAQMLNGQRIAIVGKLAGMSRRDVEQLIRERGGQVVPQIDADTNMVVLSDDAGDFARFAGAADLLDDSARLAWQDGRLEFVRETEFWALLGLVDADQHVHRLYTPAMLAELLKVPVQAIRHWHRKGRLIAVRRVGRLPYFDFDEVQVGRRLAALLNAGCSLSTVDRKLDELSRLQPQLRRPLADANVVIAGNRLCLRQGEAISEPTGQLMIDFDTVDDPIADRDNESKSTIPFSMAAANSVTLSTSIEPDESADTDELRSLVLDFEENGELGRAIEVYRAILLSGQQTAEDHFCIADLLYRSGDLPAARERYYSAIELDDDYVEARANLGCVLAEQGEMLLAEAAFRGALRYHPSFADAHFHLARLLDSMNRPRDAGRHWHKFLALAPASPWAEEARDRLRGLSTSGIAQPSQVEQA
jgi:DNA-binding transcriptional MerR regulator